jgi:hypothetical protein
VRNAAMAVRVGNIAALFCGRNHHERTKVEGSRPVGLVSRGLGSMASFPM